MSLALRSKLEVPLRSVTERDSLAEQSWRAWHVYGSETIRGLSGPLLESVLPAVRHFRDSGWIDRFFFVRYSDPQGPHLRVRLRVTPAAGESGHDLRIEQHLAEAGPVRAEPFHPETSRYGGEELLPLSLDFFCVSTRAAIEVLEATARMDRSQQLQPILKRLIHQAVGSAAEHDELLALLDYFRAWRPTMAKVVEKADRIYEVSQGAYQNLLTAEVRRARSNIGSDPLVSQARELADALRPLAHRERLAVLSSQMHMTANRFGLLNAEESYLTRIACRAIGDLSLEDAAALWADDESPNEQTRDCARCPSDA